MQAERLYQRRALRYDRNIKLIVAIPAGLLSLNLVAPLGAQNIWDGVYTTAQAERGKTAFETNCINCHSRDLAGSVRGPALRGDKFLLNWRDGSVNNLFSKIRFFMPATYPDSVSDEVKLDIVAYLLRIGRAQNRFGPAGSYSDRKEGEHGAAEFCFGTDYRMFSAGIE